MGHVGDARDNAVAEPTFGILFGILKEQMGAGRLLLRGLANVKAEFVMLATAFNLRTLWRVYASWSGPPSTPWSLLRERATGMTD
jgi:hypothetical protein